MGIFSLTSECASICKDTATVFLFGTADFGYSEGCDGVGGKCRCYCEKSATADGTCSMAYHNGYHLYKYIDPSK